MAKKDYSKIQTRFFDDNDPDMWTGIFPDVVKRDDRILLGKKCRVVSVVDYGEMRHVRVSSLGA